MLLKDSVDETVAVLTLDGTLEEQLAEAVQSTPAGINVAVAPDAAGLLFHEMTTMVDQMIANGQQPVVLAAPHIRLAFRKLTAANFPNLFVLSYNEIAPDVEIASVGNIALSYEDSEIRSPEHAGSPATSPR